MAVVTVPRHERRIEGEAEVAAFLLPYGIRYERWPLEERCNPDASNEDILAAYAPEIEKLKAQGGYVTADVINVNPQTPGLDAMLARLKQILLNFVLRTRERGVPRYNEFRRLFHLEPVKTFEELAGLGADDARAARLLGAFESWRTLEPGRQALAKAALERLAAAKLSTDSYEIVTKTLGAG